MTDAIIINGRFIDLSNRVQQSNTVVASPSAASETVICQLAAFDNQVTFALGVLLVAECAYTIGTSGASCQVRIRTGTTAGSGTVLYDSGAQTGGHNTATQLVADSAGWFHTTPTAGQTYCLTLTIASGAATSTVSKATMTAIAI